MEEDEHSPAHSMQTGQGAVHQGMVYHWAPKEGEMSPFPYVTYVNIYKDKRAQREMEKTRQGEDGNYVSAWSIFSFDVRFNCFTSTNLVFKLIQSENE